MGYYYLLSSHRKSFLTFDGAKIVHFSDGRKGKTIKYRVIFPKQNRGNLASHKISPIFTFYIKKLIADRTV